MVKACSYDSIPPPTEKDRLLMMKPEEVEEHHVRITASKRITLIWFLFIACVIFCLSQCAINAVFTPSRFGLIMSLGDITVTPCQEVGSPNVVMCESSEHCGQWFMDLMRVMNISNLVSTLACSVLLIDLIAGTFPAYCRPPYRLLMALSYVAMALSLAITVACVISMANVRRSGICPDPDYVTPAPAEQQSMLSTLFT